VFVCVCACVVQLLLWRQCGFRVDSYNLQLISAGTAGHKSIYFYCRYLVLYMCCSPRCKGRAAKVQNVNIVKAGRYSLAIR